MANPIPPASETHKITLTRALQIIAKYTIARGNGQTPHRQVRGGTFNKAQLRQILNNSSCAGVRFYFAIERAGDIPGASGGVIGDDDQIPTIVIVGVDANGNDILTEADGSLSLAAESSWPCPPHCGTASQLTNA